LAAEDSVLLRYYVAANGNDTAENAGTESNPFATVNAALIKLREEYAVWLKAYESGLPKILAHIYIDGEIPHGSIVLSGAAGPYPPITLLDYGTAADRSLKLKSKGSLITVGKDGKLTLGGSLNLVGLSTEKSGNTETDNGTGHSEGWSLVRVEAGGNLTLADQAVIRDNTNPKTDPGSDAYGGGVSVAGTFTMSGGEIRGNTAYNGGGVFVEADGTFTMSGGEIRDNTATNGTGGGGGVFVNNRKDNTFKSGGTFTMSGGKIGGNRTEQYNSHGGGVLIAGYRIRTIAGPSPSTTTYNGGKFYKTGGVIYGNNDDNPVNNNYVVPVNNGIDRVDKGCAVYVEYDIHWRDATVHEGETLSYGGGGSQASGVGDWEK
jgi:hypothetical protein